MHIFIQNSADQTSGLVANFLIRFAAEFSAARYSELGRNYFPINYE